jgi:hypothetical protein
MAPALIQAIPYAIGIALSPFVIIATVLLLLSKRPFVNPLAYLIGWLAGIFLITWAVLHFLEGYDLSQGEPKYDGHLVNLVIGLIMMAMGAMLWFTRPKGEAEPTMPRWLSIVQNVNPALVLLIGFVGFSFNIKNLALYAGALSAILMEGQTVTQAWIELIIVIIISSLAILVPFVTVLAQGDRSADTLARWQVWLMRHQAVVSAGVLLVFGLGMLLKGLTGVI